MTLEPVLSAGGWMIAAGAGLVLLEGRRSGGRRATAVGRAVHELRGPLTAARLALYPAACGRGMAPQRARAIELELDRAALVLRDLEQRGRTRASGPGPLELVDIQDLLVACVEGWAAFAAARRATLSLGCPAGEAPLVLGQPLRLMQAAGNLIANAVEHGGAAAIEVACRCEGAMVRIEVTDDGQGLPGSVSELLAGHPHPPHHNRARPPLRWFGQSRCSDPRRGHGLAVAVEVADAHSGRLSAAPTQQGARLVLEPPRACGVGQADRLADA